TDADNRYQASAPRRLGLGTHHRICLAMIRAPLRVADDHVASTRVAQHLRRNITRVGATRLRVAVLSAYQHTAPFHRFRHGHDEGSRRTNQYLTVAPGRLPDPIRDTLGESQTVGSEAVHFPVAGDQRTAGTGHEFLLICSPRV